MSSDINLKYHVGSKSVMIIDTINTISNFIIKVAQKWRINIVSIILLKNEKWLNLNWIPKTQVMTIQEYGLVVKSARTKKGLTQSELAEQCHIGLRTIQRIETGKVSPRIQTVKLLNAFLGIHISDFSEMKLNKIDYKSIYYLGLSVVGLGVVFMAAINVYLGASFIAVGLLNVYVGLKNRTNWFIKWMIPGVALLS